MGAMKAIKLIIALLLLGAAGVGNAWADHGGHVRFGVTIGPYWGPGYYPPSPYYYPPYYSPYYPSYYQPMASQAPQVYIEQQPALVAAPDAPVAAAPVNYWYYCAKAKGYYPYVKACPSGWQRVLPQPPGQP
jgi:hypothetical protein